jgi:hypothetical protein
MYSLPESIFSPLFMILNSVYMFLQIDLQKKKQKKPKKKKKKRLFIFLSSIIFNFQLITHLIAMCCSYHVCILKVFFFFPSGAIK